MSLIPSKLKLFMTERCSLERKLVRRSQPRLKQINSIVDWPVPEDASHLEAFWDSLAIPGSLVRDMPKERPTANPATQVPIPPGTKNKIPTDHASLQSRMYGRQTTQKRSWPLKNDSFRNQSSRHQSTTNTFHSNNGWAARMPSQAS